MYQKHDQTTVYTDGSCIGNPGPGGWGVLIHGRNGKQKELKGYERDTTNNRMELTAVIKALEWLKQPRFVRIITDSQYVEKGITQWIEKWKQNNWRSAGKKPVKNQDLWQRLDALNQHHNVSWEWVRAHSGDVGNERADAIARSAIPSS